MLTQKIAPIYQALKNYIKDQALAFHTPGHKQGQGASTALKKMMSSESLLMDVSLMAELDDLHEPQSYIKDAQALAAQLYQADSSYFVINGTTCAIQAMILASVGRNDKILIPRNAHSSVIGGIILAGAQPIYLEPETDEMLGIAMAVSPETIEEALLKEPDAKAVLIVNPTYYGVVADIKKIAKIVHSHNKILLVDEAHGPHLIFNEKLPISALEAGADIVAQSTHKILAAMTQCSMLHCRHDNIDVVKLEKVLSLLQSTSPNYLLLASLDLARQQMATSGKELLDKVITLSCNLRQAINQIEGLSCFGREKENIYDLDCTKITVSFKGLGLTGLQAEQILRNDYKIQAELADAYNVLFIITIGDDEASVHTLLGALRAMAVKFQNTVNHDLEIKLPQIPPQVIFPQAAFYASKKSLAFKDAIGAVCGETITFYPPGIPIICQGEEITIDIYEYCQKMVQAGYKVVGPVDCKLEQIRVVK